MDFEVIYRCQPFGFLYLCDFCLRICLSQAQLTSPAGQGALGESRDGPHVLTPSSTASNGKSRSAYLLHIHVIIRLQAVVRLQGLRIGSVSQAASPGAALTFETLRGQVALRGQRSHGGWLSTDDRASSEGFSRLRPTSVRVLRCRTCASAVLVLKSVALTSTPQRV